MDQQNPQDLPEESQFLSVSASHQDNCAAKSRDSLKSLPSEVQETVGNLGTLLSHLDRFASCSWGCHGREHSIEYLVGRTVSSARAALRLIEFGHYDEALALTRGIFEIGNLLWFFFISPSAIRDWIDLSDKERRARYSPVAVRRAIESAGSVVPHPQADYAWLCEIAVHPTPRTTPEAHNAHGVPTLGGVYQERGQVKCLLWLAWAVASVAGPAAKVALLERSRAESIVAAAIRLVDELPQSGDEQEATESCDQVLEKTKWLDRVLRKRKDTS